MNDGLMVIFFFVVGLEIKRELASGDLADRNTAIVPAIAAIGGMLIPASIFVLVNLGTDDLNGWAIPTATDIAFVIGVLALMRNRLPSGIKIFLLTLAIVDDLLAIVVIAIFYTNALRPRYLVVAVLIIVIILVMQRLRVFSPWAYVLPALGLWWSIFESGVHATIAGVILGLLVPVQPIRGRAVFARVEAFFHPISSYFVMPVFAIANAGVIISLTALSGAVSSRFFWGIFLGLVVGKAIGVSLFTWIALGIKGSKLPAGMRFAHLPGAAALAGIGFTVSLFIAELSDVNRETTDLARIAILLASFLAAVIGSSLLLAVGKGKAAPRDAVEEEAQRERYQLTLLRQSRENPQHEADEESGESKGSGEPEEEDGDG